MLSLDPDRVTEPQSIAAQINTIAATKQRSSTAPPDTGRGDKLDRLERLAALVATGTVTDAEAEQLRHEILHGG